MSSVPGVAFQICRLYVACLGCNYMHPVLHMSSVACLLFNHNHIHPVIPVFMFSFLPSHTYEYGRWADTAHDGTAHDDGTAAYDAAHDDDAAAISATSASYCAKARTSI
jgi:hypothetical protein